MHGSKGFIYSTALHCIILFLLIVGLPSFLQPIPDAEPEAITVDILPIAPISNVKPQDDAPKAPVQKEAQEVKQQLETHAKPQKEEPPPPPPAPPKPKEVVKPPPPKKPQPPKPKTKEDPLKSIFEGIQHDAAKEGPKQAKSATDTSKHVAKSTHYDPGAPLSMSEKNAIVQQINDKWNFNQGSKNASTLLVSLHIELARDGTVTKVEFTGSQSRYSSDPFFRAAVDSAIRAVQRASPLKNLAPEKYHVQDGWGEMDITFHPPDT